VTVEEQTQDAITITRMLLFKAMETPSVIVAMTRTGMALEDIEDNVADILKYLDMTKPEESPETYDEVLERATKTYEKGIERASKVYDKTMKQTEKTRKEAEG